MPQPMSQHPTNITLVSDWEVQQAVQQWSQEAQHAWLFALHDIVTERTHSGKMSQHDFMLALRPGDYRAAMDAVIRERGKELVTK
jgi:hypothetical protein